MKWSIEDCPGKSNLVWGIRLIASNKGVISVINRRYIVEGGKIYRPRYSYYHFSWCCIYSLIGKDTDFKP
jgi:hypothetical protein